jgi:cytochrome c peroxidase
MRFTAISFVTVAIGATCIFQCCSKTTGSVAANAANTLAPALPAAAYIYAGTVYPQHILTDLLKNDNTPPDNAITNDGATLGRVLFYDKQLSKNNTISCSSCHKQDQSFDDNETLSKGFQGGLTTRNSMTLLNLRFYKSGKMFWDERAATLEQQVLQPIQNTTEMGLSITELETRLSTLDYYPSLFQKAFGSSRIDSNSIAKALAQFLRSMVTYQSKYDRVKQGLEPFTAEEQQGEQLFLTAGAQTCAGCHAPPMFLTSQPAAAFALRDAADRGINNQDRFKSGSLRNIGIRTRLFHNGTVVNLQTMLGITANGTPPIPNHTVAPQDAQKILLFLQTLTDQTVLTETKFTDPFKQ